jgi:nicotinamidase-related amidase
MLQVDNTVLVVVDVQEKLFPAIYEKELLLENVTRLVRGAALLEVPVLVTEQNPAGLGQTLPELAALLPGFNPVPKFTFSCLGEPVFRRALEATGRREVLLAGIESHVCVYQTACHLMAAGYSVSVISDAVSSRTKANRKVGLRAMQMAGARPSSVEMALFELLVVARGPVFKEIIRLVK